MDSLAKLRKSKLKDEFFKALNTDLSKKKSERTSDFLPQLNGINHLNYNLNEITNLEV